MKQCNCKEMSCTKECTKNHTHKGFFCDSCHSPKPEENTYEKISKATERLSTSVRDKMSGYPTPDTTEAVAKHNEEIGKSLLKMIKGENKVCEIHSKILIKEIDELILEALPDLRQITFHTDGRVIAKTGGRAKFPKKLYTGRGQNVQEMLENALSKLIKENKV